MRYFAGLVGALLLALSCSTQAAEPYPDKPIRLIVPFSPGGSIDLVARTVAPKLSAQLGQPVLIDNRPGASGNIGMDLVAKSKADGYTLLVSANVFAANPHMFAKLPFDAEKDFANITRIADQANVLVTRPDLGVKSVAELIALAKANPGKITYGSAGPGSTQHVAAELFVAKAGVKMLHVPYKGGAPALTDLLGGQIDVIFDTAPSIVGYIQSEKVVALGVTSTSRLETLPKVPTIAEAGVPGYEYRGWIGLAAPAGTPKPVIAKLHTALSKSIQTDLRQAIIDISLSPVGDTPEEFNAFITKDSEGYEWLVKQGTIPIQ